MMQSRIICSLEALTSDLQVEAKDIVEAVREIDTVQRA